MSFHLLIKQKIDINYKFKVLLREDKLISNKHASYPTILHIKTWMIVLELHMEKHNKRKLNKVTMTFPHDRKTVNNTNEKILPCWIKTAKSEKIPNKKD